MATWGQKKVHYNKYSPESSLYYEYNTSSDQYKLRLKTEMDYGMGIEKYENDYHFGPDEGEVIMEAFINHILAFDYSGNEEAFIERFIKKNRFKGEST